MDENLESLFEDVFSDTPAEEPAAKAQETPADDKSQQEGNDTSGKDEAKKEPMPPDERARQAHGRRMREAEQKGYLQARKDLDTTIRELGIEKPDGSRISTVDELEAFAKAQRNDRLSKGTPTEADIQAVVMETIQAQQTPQRQQEAQLSAEERATVDRQLAEIRQEDPEMKDLDAILNSAAGPKFRELVGKGLDFKDAYELAAKERLAGIRANRAGTKGAGKDHLNATRQQGAGALDVPREDMAYFRALNPEASDDEIRKYYNADRKKYGGG